MFFIWLLSFFNFYFITFQEGCTNYIRSLLSTTISNKGQSLFGIIKRDPSSQVYFKLTEEALSKGFSDLHMHDLTKEWYISIGVSTYFNVYSKITNYINNFILVIQMSI